MFYPRVAGRSNYLSAVVMRSFLAALAVIMISIFSGPANADSPKTLFYFASPDADKEKDYKVVRKVVLDSGIPSDEGTIEMWVCPWGWGSGEGKWHFFLEAGNNIDPGLPKLILYKFPDDKLRLLWQESATEKKVIDILQKVEFEADKWHHLAFTWKQGSRKCDVSLYLDGKLLGRRTGAFELNMKAFSGILHLGDAKGWNPASDHGTAIKDLLVLDKALSTEQIAAEAKKKLM